MAAVGSTVHPDAVRRRPRSLRWALERAGIATLQRNYLHRQVADAYHFDVSYQVWATVSADEGVLPEAPRPVVDMLVKLIA